MNWDSVVEDLGPRLYKYFCVRFAPEQADDMTQETLIRLVRKVDQNKYDPEKGTLKMLAFGIAHYVALESNPVKPHENIDEWEDVVGDEQSLEQAMMAQEAVFQVRKQMKNLSSIEQQILSLLVDQELSLKEISRILGIPEGTVKSHVFRAKKKLIVLIQKASS